jgi:hypothetical protein
MDLGGVLRLAHALAGIAFASGIVGMWIVHGAAERADSIASMRLLIRSARPFGRLAEVGGIGVAILGIATAFVLGRPIFGPLTGGRLDWMFVSNVILLPLIAFLAVVYPRFATRLRAALDAAGETGAVPAGVTAAWADPAYRFARRYELVSVVIVLALMIGKPF